MIKKLFAVDQKYNNNKILESWHFHIWLIFRFSLGSPPKVGRLKNSENNQWTPGTMGHLWCDVPRATKKIIWFCRTQMLMVVFVSRAGPFLQPQMTYRSRSPLALMKLRSWCPIREHDDAPMPRPQLNHGRARPTRGSRCGRQEVQVRIYARVIYHESYQFIRFAGLVRVCKAYLLHTR